MRGKYDHVAGCRIHTAGICDCGNWDVLPDMTKHDRRDVRVVQVIETTLTHRGRGVEGDPFYRVTQYWSMDGELLAEREHR